MSPVGTERGLLMTLGGQAAQHTGLPAWELLFLARGCRTTKCPSGLLEK